MASARQVRPASALPVQLRVTLVGVHPPVWRRIRVPGRLSLGGLHRVIQATMGWDDYHLHKFEIGENTYGAADEEQDLDVDQIDEESTSIEAAFNGLLGGTYTYDFGDGWEHEIVLEETAALEPLRYAACVDGRRACPPEDCGGVPGYASLIEMLSDPTCEEYEEIMEWLGGEFDPEAFDLVAVNATLRRVR